MSIQTLSTRPPVETRWDRFLTGVGSVIGFLIALSVILGVATLILHVCGVR